MAFEGMRGSVENAILRLGMAVMIVALSLAQQRQKPLMGWAVDPVGAHDPDIDARACSIHDDRMAKSQ